MSVIEKCTVKPVCSEADGRTKGVDDDCGQVCVSFEAGIDPQYLPFTDSCTCEGQDQFKKICSANTRQNPYFRPAEAKAEEKIEDGAKMEISSIEDASARLTNSITEMDGDSEAMITGEVKVRFLDDGTAVIEIPFSSPETVDAVAEGSWDGSNPTNVWESLDQDIDYLSELCDEAMKTLPDGWKISPGSATDIPIDENGKPDIGRDGTFEVKLSKKL